MTGTKRPPSRALLACGIVGPPLFVLVFLVEGATRPGYSPWGNYVSQLSLGDQGWVQVANFFVFGLLTMGFAAGVRQAPLPGRGAFWSSTLLGLFGLSVFVAGIFPTDPFNGYPPSTPSGPATAGTLHAAIHSFAGLIAFTSLPAACFMLARSFATDPSWKGWAAYSIITGVVELAFFLASGLAQSQPGALDEIAGILQRISIVVGWAWITLFAIELLRKRGASS